MKDTDFDVEELESQRTAVVRLGEDPTLDTVYRIAAKRLSHDPWRLRKFIAELGYRDGETYEQRRRRLFEFYEELYAMPKKFRRDRDQ